VIILLAGKGIILYNDEDKILRKTFRRDTPQGTSAEVAQDDTLVCHSEGVKRLKNLMVQSFQIMNYEL